MTTFWFLWKIKHQNHATFMSQKVVTQTFIIEPIGDKYFRHQKMVLKLFYIGTFYGNSHQRCVNGVQGVPHQYGIHQYDFHQYKLLCSKIRTSGNWLCSTHQYEFCIVQFFPNPKNRTKRGPPVLIRLVPHLQFSCLNIIGLYS